MGNKYYLLIAAAGEGKRFGKDKLFLKIKGKTILEWSISNFKNIKFQKKVLILKKEKIKDEKIKKIFKDFLIVEGGGKRAISVYNGFNAISPEKNSYIIIHDGARPYAPKFLIKNLIKEAKNEKGVVPVLSSRDTIKRIENDYIKETIDRKGLFLVQTPYIFKASVLMDCYKQKKEKWENLTDESQLLELLEIPVKVIEGSPLNIKITYKEDFEIMKKILMLKYKDA